MPSKETTFQIFPPHDLFKEYQSGDSYKKGDTTFYEETTVDDGGDIVKTQTAYKAKEAIAKSNGFNADEWEPIIYEAVIRKPNFEQLNLGLSSMITKTGNMNLGGGGKSIFDTCKVKCDKEIINDSNYLLSLCLKISEKYLTVVEAQIKKN